MKTNEELGMLAMEFHDLLAGRGLSTKETMDICLFVAGAAAAESLKGDTVSAAEAFVVAGPQLYPMFAAGYDGVRQVLEARAKEGGK